MCKFIMHDWFILVPQRSSGETVLGYTEIIVVDDKGEFYAQIIFANQD